MTGNERLPNEALDLLHHDGRRPPSVVEVMFHHAHTPPPRPSTRSELPIPAPLEDLLMECLEKDPARRPASAEAVSTRLDAVSLESAWTVERAERWWAAQHARVELLR